MAMSRDPMAMPRDPMAMSRDPMAMPIPWRCLGMYVCVERWQAYTCVIAHNSCSMACIYVCTYIYIYIYIYLLFFFVCERIFLSGMMVRGAAFCLHASGASGPGATMQMCTGVHAL